MKSIALAFMCLIGFIFALQDQPVVEPPAEAVATPVATPIAIATPIATPVAVPVSQNPPSCIASGCGCVAPGQLAIKCLNDDQARCFSRYGICQRDFISGKCGWIFNQALRNCLNSANYCVKQGCGLENCVINRGIEILIKCLRVPGYRKCYEAARCIVGNDGDCAYAQTPALRYCLRTSGN